MNPLKVLWNKWQKLAHQIANFQSRLILTIVYILLILPMGLIFRIVSDPLHLKRKLSWRKFTLNSTCIDQVKNQF